jgi:predicted RNA binding protein YcfA (HicA-like mRNA interferase family)
VPRKIRQLIADLRDAGFTMEPGRGSHRKFFHPSGAFTVLSGHNDGADAKPYQEKQIRKAIEASKKGEQP